MGEQWNIIHRSPFCSIAPRHRRLGMLVNSSLSRIPSRLSLWPNRHLRFFVKFFSWQPHLQPLFDNRKETHSQLTALLTNSALTYRHLLFLIPQRISFEGARSNSCCSPRDQRLLPLLGFCRDELGGAVNRGVRVSRCRQPHRKARGLASIDK